jgi:hypothetical protein
MTAAAAMRLVSALAGENTVARCDVNPTVTRAESQLPPPMRRFAG